MNPSRDPERQRAATRAARRAAQERAELVHRKMQQAAHFFGAFAAQMNVIAPRARQTMELPGVMRFPDLVIRDLFVEERMQQPHDMSATLSGSGGTGARYEYMLLSFHYLGSRSHSVVRELAPEIERLEALLAMHRIRFEVKLYRNARALVERAVFRIHSNISAGVKLIPDYSQARVRVALRNIDRLATWEVSVPASDLSQPMFEELARCVLGQPNSFQRMALGERPATATSPAAAKD